MSVPIVKKIQKRYSIMFLDIRLIIIIVASIIIWTKTEAAFTEKQIRGFGATCHASKADLNVTLKYEVPNTPTGKEFRTEILILQDPNRILISKRGCNKKIFVGKTHRKSLPYFECLMECILKIIKIVNKYGLYDRNATLEGLKIYWSEVNTSALEKLADKCDDKMAAFESLAHKDGCEYGYRVASCLHLKYEEESADGCNQEFIYVPYHKNTFRILLNSTTEKSQKYNL